MFCCLIPCSRRSLLLLLFFSLGYSIPAQSAGYDYLMGRNFTERARLFHDLIDSLVKKDPSSVIQKLKEGEAWALSKNKRELEFSFRLWRYQFETTLSSRVTNSPQIEKNFISFVNESEKAELLYLKIHAMSLLADYYWGVKMDYGHAFEYELKAYELYKDIRYSDHPIKGEYIYQFAGKYYGFKDYQNAKRLMLTLDAPAGNQDHPGAHLYYNLVGLCYRNMNIYDSAEYYFKIGYRKTVDTKDSTYHAIIGGNIGITYYYQQRYDAAIPLLERDIQYCMENNRASDNAAKSLSILGDIYFRKGNVEKAAALLNTAHELVKREGYWRKYELLEFVYPVMAKIKSRQGNNAMAYAYLDSSIAVRDSMSKQRGALILAGAQNLVAAQLHIAEIQKMTDQKRIQVLIRNSLLIIVTFFGAVALLFINRQKIINKRRQERLLSEKQLIAAELSSAADQLEMFTKNIHEKNALIEQFSSQLESLQTSRYSVQNDEPETLVRLRESTILTDEEWENFRKLFERVHSGYLQRLKTKIPGLSPAETRFLALAKLQLSNKEMAGMLGISTDAVRMNKHRLRKKLNLPEETSIEELLESF
jgi:DNA-binding CsgD family transcriptional regulator